MAEVCSIEMLHRLLRLDPETGDLFWRERTVDLFEDCKNPERVCKIWNTRFAGTRALYSISSPMWYRCGRIFGRIVRAHRVVFAITNGYWPKQIDHIDGNPLNNHPSNLRECTRTENNRNAAMNYNNTSGHTGVCWHKRAQAWMARISIGGKEKYLGCFDNIDDAVAARKTAEQGHGFTDRHGTKRV